MKKTVKITREGKVELENELKDLIARRPEMAERIATARDFGDLSENEDYSAARMEQKVMESRISQIEEILKNASVIRAVKADKVGVGSTVVVNDGKKDFEYFIVGPVEANPLERKISNESPLGVALMGKGVGDGAVFEAPKGRIDYKIIEIK